MFFQGSISPDDKKFIFEYYDIIDTANRHYIYDRKVWNGEEYVKEEEKEYMYYPLDLIEDYYDKYYAVYFLDIKELRLIKKVNPRPEHWTDPRWVDNNTILFHEYINGKDEQGVYTKYDCSIGEETVVNVFDYGYDYTETERTLKNQLKVNSSYTKQSENERIVIWRIDEKIPKEAEISATNKLLVFDRKKQEIIFTYQNYYSEVAAMTYTGKYVYIRVTDMFRLDDNGDLINSEQKYYVLELPVED